MSVPSGCRLIELAPCAMEPAEGCGPATAWPPVDTDYLSLEEVDAREGAWTDTKGQPVRLWIARGSAVQIRPPGPGRASPDAASGDVIDSVIKANRVQRSRRQMRLLGVYQIPMEPTQISYGKSSHTVGAITSSLTDNTKDDRPHNVSLIPHHQPGHPLAKKLRRPGFGDYFSRTKLGYQRYDKNMTDSPRKSRHVVNQESLPHVHRPAPHLLQGAGRTEGGGGVATCEAVEIMDKLITPMLPVGKGNKSGIWSGSAANPPADRNHIFSPRQARHQPSRNSNKQPSQGDLGSSKPVEIHEDNIHLSFFPPDVQSANTRSHRSASRTSIESHMRTRPYKHFQKHEPSDQTKQTKFHGSQRDLTVKAEKKTLQPDKSYYSTKRNTSPRRKTFLHVDYLRNEDRPTDTTLPNGESFREGTPYDEDDEETERSRDHLNVPSGDMSGFHGSPRSHDPSSDTTLESSPESFSVDQIEDSQPLSNNQTLSVTIKSKSKFSGPTTENCVAQTPGRYFVGHRKFESRGAVPRATAPVMNVMPSMEHPPAPIFACNPVAIRPKSSKQPETPRQKIYLPHMDYLFPKSRKNIDNNDASERNSFMKTTKCSLPARVPKNVMFSDDDYAIFQRRQFYTRDPNRQSLTEKFSDDSSKAKFLNVQISLGGRIGTPLPATPAESVTITEADDRSSMSEDSWVLQQNTVRRDSSMIENFEPQLRQSEIIAVCWRLLSLSF